MCHRQTAALTCNTAEFREYLILVSWRSPRPWRRPLGVSPSKPVCGRRYSVLFATRSAASALTISSGRKCATSVAPARCATASGASPTVARFDGNLSRCRLSVSLRLDWESAIRVWARFHRPDHHACLHGDQVYAGDRQTFPRGEDNPSVEDPVDHVDEARVPWHTFEFAHGGLSSR